MEEMPGGSDAAASRRPDGAGGSPEARLARVRAQAVAGGAAFVLAVVAFAALANATGGHLAQGGLRSELEQTSSTLDSFEHKLTSDKSRLSTVIHRLGEIKSAEAQIRQEQAELLAKEQSTRASVHEARNKMVSLKYKIHNMKAVAFSNAMFGLSGKEGQKAKAQAHLERKAQHLEAEREDEVREEEHTSAPRRVKAEVSHVLRVDADHVAQHPALHRAAQSLSSHARASSASIIAAGLRKTKAQADLMRSQARAHAAARLQQKARMLEREREASEKRKQQMEANAIARQAAEYETKARKANAAAATAKDVSRMQAAVLRKRVATFEPPTSEARAATAHRDTHPAHAPQRSERAVQHKPLSLSQAADMAAKQAQKAQAMAFMRSPQYWASQQATHETKRFGSMPRLPLLSPLNPAAADA
jgi:hypothetical protein